METATNEKMVQNHVWIFPAQCFVMLYMNDRRNLSGDKVSESEKLQIERRNNVQFYRIQSPYRATSFRSYKLFAGMLFRSLMYPVEVLVDFGSIYEFN